MDQLWEVQKTQNVTFNKLPFSIKNNDFGLRKLITYINLYRINDEYTSDININPTMLEICASLNSILEETDFGRLIIEAQSTNNYQKVMERFYKIKDTINLFFHEKLEINWRSYNILLCKFLKLFNIINKFKNIKKIPKTILEEFDEIGDQIIKINTQLYIADGLIKMDYQKTI